MDQNDEHTVQPVILIAEDDPDDQFLIKTAFQSSGYSSGLHFVLDGEELMDFLIGRKKYAETGPVMPGCLLLDLKMPRKDGREALKEIRQNPKFDSLPVLILSTSDSDHDRNYCTRLGVSEYITKPDSFAGLLEVVEKARSFCIFPS